MSREHDVVTLSGAEYDALLSEAEEAKRLREELAALPASRTVTEEMVEALKRIRDTAMEHTLAARIPECGVFGCIAQDADWLMREIAAAMEEGQ